MALDLSPYGIRINAIAPGYVSTELNADALAGEYRDKLKKGIPFQRFEDYADLEGPLLLLAADTSAYMTGSEIVVGGGHLCSSL